MLARFLFILYTLSAISYFANIIIPNCYNNQKNPSVHQSLSIHLLLCDFIPTDYVVLLVVYILTQLNRIVKNVHSFLGYLNFCPLIKEAKNKSDLVKYLHAFFLVGTYRSFPINLMFDRCLFYEL
jgi:hypothetical protein